MMGSSASQQPDETVEISFKRVPQISAYLDSIANGDDDVVALRLAELSAEKWTKAEWNVMGIATRVALLGNPSYTKVLQIVQRMGGCGHAEPEAHLEMESTVLYGNGELRV